MSIFSRIRPKGSAADDTTPAFPNGIKVWYDPGVADVDIVFIHGVTGDRERTWTHEAAVEPWPKAILPEHLPTARILTFGYDAYIIRRSTAVVNQLMDHSRDFLNVLTSLRHRTRASDRALIFVAHSLGGPVCKDAILQSRNNPDSHLRAVFESIVAIAFLGTPHGGSDLASWARIPAKALGVLKSTNTDLLSVLQTSSEVLHRVQHDFLSMTRDLASHGRSLKMTCFWEAKPMPLAGTIVERRSATLPGYNAVSIHANHRDMARFLAADDPGFVSLLKELRRWLADIQSSELDLTADLRARELEGKRLEQTKIECLKSLTFDEIGSRKLNIDRPNLQTCEWIFHDRRYQNWVTLGGGRDSHNLLWIKGKPGSGKSTLMKRILQEHENQPPSANTVCLNFFFNARGAQLEKSTLGLYRTLLFQLLQKSKATMAQFLPHFLEKEEQHLGEKVTWHLSEISNFFHSAISELLAARLYIFIDAMDECEEYEVRKMVRDFENSLVAAMSHGSTVKICLSSRHYPHISLRLVPGLEILVEHHNASDIRHYVSQELTLGENDLRLELCEGISKKSDGIFFWVLFMVRRLLKASDQGFTSVQMKNLLQSVPPTLQGLFEATLMSMEPERLCSFTAMAPWIICAFRPLKLYELWVALAFTADKQPLSLVGPKAGSKFDEQQFSKFVIDVSGGLFECISINKEIVVQVIHESFREFLLRPTRAAELMRIPPGTSFQRHAHERIMAASRGYFNVKEIRRALPRPDRDGNIAVEKLTAMLCKPLAVPFALLASHGVSYFHEYVFLHLKEIVDYPCVDARDSMASLCRTGKTILEGWLVVLYYIVLQTGALSPPQCEALDLLVQAPSMVGLSMSEVECVGRRANNLVIFVNKAMKDGFVLTDTSMYGFGNNGFAHDGNINVRAGSLLYLRMFGHGMFTEQMTDQLGAVNMFDKWNGDWKVYEQSLEMSRIVGICHSSGLHLGLAFCMMAEQTPQLTEVRECWKRRQFPSCTTTLFDWQIVEKLSFFPQAKFCVVEDILTTSLQPGVGSECSSVLLEIQPPRKITFDENVENGAFISGADDPPLLRILATREDWEIKHYSLWKCSSDTIEDKQHTPRDLI